MKRSLIALAAPAAGVASTSTATRLPSAPAGVVPGHLMARQANATNVTIAEGHKVLVEAAGKIVGYDFNGTAFIPNSAANVSEPGETASWMVFKEPNFLYAVDENSIATRLFNYNPATGVLSQEIASWNGSAGTVHLAFSQDKKRLIGASYTQGQVDVWDASGENGMLRLMKQIPLDGTPGPVPVRQATLRAHQIVFDPTGRFFIVNDLGGDKLHVFDTQADAFTMTSGVQVTPPGSGPRHGAFLAIDGGKQATHYVVVNELSNTVQLFAVAYSSSSLDLKKIQTISTCRAELPPVNSTSAAAGELIVNHSAGPVSIYISNRLTGNMTDNIARFAIEKVTAPVTNGTLSNSTGGADVQLVLKGQIGTGGAQPRHFSLSKKDESIMYIANMNGQNGLFAVPRCVAGQEKGECKMDSVPKAKLDNTEFADPSLSGQGFGPQFVIEF